MGSWGTHRARVGAGGIGARVGLWGAHRGQSGGGGKGLGGLYLVSDLSYLVSHLSYLISRAPIWYSIFPIWYSIPLTGHQVGILHSLIFYKIIIITAQNLFNFTCF